MPNRNLKKFAMVWMALLLLGLGVGPPITGQENQPSDGFSTEDFAKFAIRMQKEVEALRGWKFKYPVDIDLYTEEQVRAYIEEPLEREEGWPEYSRADTAMKMIRLIPQDSGLLDTARKMFINMAPPGLYNARTKELRAVKKPGMDLNSLSFQVIFIHELTHALDDQYFDLRKMMEIAQSSSDAEIAIGAIVEGSAMTVQQRYMNKIFLSGKANRTQALQSMASAMGDMQAVFKAPLYFITMFFARFTCGTAFLQFGASTLNSGSESLPSSINQKSEAKTGEAPQRGGPALKCIDKAMKMAATNLPSSSEQILHPEKFWRIEARDEPVIVKDKDVEELLTREGLYTVHKNTFGELGCAVLTFPEEKRLSPADMPLPPSAWTNQSAIGWGGDRFFLLASGLKEENIPQQPEKLYGIWFTMWDTTDDCNEFIAAYKTHRPSPLYSALKLGERCAIFLFNFESSQRKALQKRLQTTPPGFTQNGNPWFFTSAVGPGIRSS